MITKLEREFYDTFGIKPKWKDKRVKSIKTYYTEEQAQYLRETTKNRNIQLCYPEITAKKLLEMICIYNEFQNNCDYLVVPINIKTFKDDFLKIMIKSVNDKYTNEYFCNDINRYKTEIQQLFKEVNNGTIYRR